MNPKFFDVKKEKQDAIINACLKVFAENGYKKASTDVIVKNAGISKGLLFHYFESKKGAYEFIYNYSVKYMTLELTQSVKKSERDFFDVQRTIEGVKTRVMRNYSYMQQFLDGIRYEDHPDALAVIGDDKDVLRDTFNAIYRQADMSRFDDDVDVNKVISMISWMSEGFIRDRFRDEENPDLDEMNEEFSGYLEMLRAHLYKSDGIGRLNSVRKRREGVESRIVLESMRESSNPNKRQAEKNSVNKPSSLRQLANQLGKSPEQLSFEERLISKDTSIFGVPAPKKEEKKAEVKPQERILIVSQGKSRKPDEKKEDKQGSKKEPEDKAVKKVEAGESRTSETAEDRKPDKEKEAKAFAGEEIKEDRAKEESKGSADEERKSEEAVKENQKEEAQKEEAQKEEAQKEEVQKEETGKAEEAGGAEAEETGKGSFLTEPEKEEAGPVETGLKGEKEAGLDDEKAQEERSLNRSSEPGNDDAFSAKEYDAENTSRLYDSVDSDLVELNEIFSRSLGEAEEEVLMSDLHEGAKEQAFDFPEITYQESADEVGPEGYYGYDGGMGEQYYGPEGDYYPQDMYAPNGYAEGYMENTGYPGQQGYVYEDDSAAYAELYNSVYNYDVTGQTQEMPVNEVLAYRNAFANEYMQEEPEVPATEQKENTGKKPRQKPRTEKKPRKKSLFSSLFGKNQKNTENRKDNSDGDEDSDEGE